MLIGVYVEVVMKKLIVILLISILFINGCSISKTDELTNSEKFANEYEVDEDNSFEYISFDDLEDLFLGGTGLLFFGNSDCEWCINSAKVLNDIIKDEEISLINYFNPTTLSSDKQDRVLYLINEEIEDIEIEKLWLPSLYVIVDGEIIAYSNETLETILSDDLNDGDERKLLKKSYLKLIELYKEQV